MNIFVSEVLGTFFLVAVILSTGNPYYIALGFLLAILIANVSKGHINPVVTMIKYIQGAIPRADLPQYIGGQVTGAFVAYMVVTKILKKV